MEAYKGAKLSCIRWLPSSLLRHSAPSGNVTYATHPPSLVKHRCSAEIPDRYGTKWFDCESYRTSSPRGLLPVTNTFFPTLLGSGEERASGPEVNCTGSRLVFPSQLVLSRSSQMLPSDENRKCFPPGVHTPQHSAVGLCQPSSNGCAFLPSDDISHSEVAFVFWSRSVTRNSPPSGDHCGEVTHPAILASRRESVPS